MFLDIGKTSHRLQWEAKIGPNGIIPFDGIPFYVLGIQILECQHGTDISLICIRKENMHQNRRYCVLNQSNLI